MNRRIAGFLLALSAAASVTGDARAETRAFSVSETYSIRSTGPASFRTRATVPATAGGKATCTATVTGTQAMGPVVSPVFVRVELFTGDKVTSSTTGASLVIAAANVAAGSPPISCAVTLPSGAAVAAVAAGKVTLDVPTEVKAPTVAGTRMMGTPTMGTGVDGLHPVDYAPPGARVLISGTFLRLATVRFGSVRALPIWPSSDSELFFVMPTVPSGSTQLVVENPLGQVTIPWFVGTRPPEIDKATIDTYGAITVWGHNFAPIAPSGTTIVRTTVRFGDGDWLRAGGNDGTIWYTSPKGVFHGMVRVKTMGGESNDVWF